MKKLNRASMLLAGTALALVAATNANAQAGQSAASAAGSVSEVVVTGTRLKVNAFTTPTPVTTVTAASVAQSAVAAIGDVVNDIPSFKESNGPTQSQRNFPGSGQNTLDLRGLGTVRTLVLVDGERFTPSQISGTLDTNVIPTSLVERVDIVTGGASAAYGSDAVSGVVNFVLKRSLQGVVGNIQTGRSQYGDSRENYFSIAAGSSFNDDKGHVLFGTDISQNDGVGNLYSRKWGRTQPGTVVYGLARAAGVASQGFAQNVVYSAQTAGGLISAGPLKGIAFGPGGAPYSFQYGTVLSNLMTGGNNYGLNPTGHWNLQVPTKRYTALGRIDYALSDNLKAYAELNAAYTESNGTTSYQQNTFTIASGNPFIPASTQAAMTAAGLSTITVGRVLTETDGLHQHDTIQTIGGRVGLTGTVFGDWDWDASYQTGQTKFYLGVTGVTNLANYGAAVNAIMGPNGVPVCGPIATNPNLNAVQKTTVQPGCVPFNLFGFGSPSAQALAYMTGTALQNVDLRQHDASANLKGSPFATWAGPVNTAVGVEYRTESVRTSTDPISAAVGWSANNLGTFSGKESVVEAYGEADLPLAKDMAFAKSLNLNGAVRRTHYSISGNATTWKVGLTYEPITGVRFRATRSRDIRAPNLNELYASTGSSINSASGINPINGQTGALFSSSKGNQNLVPEIADTTALGVAYQPSWLRGLTASVDLYDIDIQKVIASVSVAQTLNLCAAGQQQFCSSITFNNTTFGIANVATQPQNLNNLAARGLDIEVTYNVPVPDWAGSLTVRALGTNVKKLATTQFSTMVDRAGALTGLPSWTWNFNGAYTYQNFRATLNAHYVSASLFDATLIGPGQAGYSSTLANSIADNTFPSAVYYNLGASYDLVSDGGRLLQVYGVVNNLANLQPPPYAAIAINGGGNPYDLVGRVFKLGLRFKY